jgi:hypothetical protein
MKISLIKYKSEEVSHAMFNENTSNDCEAVILVLVRELLEVVTNFLIVRVEQ